MSDDNSTERSSVDDMLCTEVKNVFVGRFLQSDDVAQTVVVVVASLSVDHHHDRYKCQMA